MSCYFCQKNVIETGGIGPSRPIEYAPYMNSDQVADSQRHEATVAKIAIKTANRVKKLHYNLYNLFSEQIRLMSLYNEIPATTRARFGILENFVPRDNNGLEINMEKTSDVTTLEKWIDNLNAKNTYKRNILELLQVPY